MQTCRADKNCHWVRKRERKKESERRKSRTRHPSSGQLRRETDLPSPGSLSRNCAYRARHSRCSPVPRARARNWISRCENTSPRGGAGYPRESWYAGRCGTGRNGTVDSRGVTSVGQLNNRPPLSFCLLLARSRARALAGPPHPLAREQCNTLRGDTSLRRPAVSFRSCIPPLRLFSPV